MPNNASFGGINSLSEEVFMEGKEEKQEIVILDCGFEKSTLIGPEGACCWNALIPYRG
jgi:hypothetical protein